MTSYTMESVSKDLDNLRSEVGNLNREVDSLRNKVDWYETAAKYFVLFLVCIVLPQLGQRHSPSNGGRTRNFNKYKVEGQWKAGGLDGYGFIVFDTGSRFRGMFQNNRRVGYGVLRQSNGDRYEGRWYDDNLNSTCAKVTYTTDHTHYIGSFYNGSLNGAGTFYWPNGISFEGHWKEDQSVGKGTFRVPLYEEVKGTWENYEDIARDHRASPEARVTIVDS